MCTNCKVHSFSVSQLRSTMHQSVLDEKNSKERKKVNETPHSVCLVLRTTYLSVRHQVHLDLEPLLMQPKVVICCSDVVRACSSHQSLKQSYFEDACLIVLSINSVLALSHYSWVDKVFCYFDYIRSVFVFSKANTSLDPIPKKIMCVLNACAPSRPFQSKCLGYCINDVTGCIDAITCRCSQQDRPSILSKCVLKINIQVASRSVCTSQKCRGLYFSRWRNASRETLLSVRTLFRYHFCRLDFQYILFTLYKCTKEARYYRALF